MNHFDMVARQWDLKPERFERSEIIANKMLEALPIKPESRALEYGAGTGILSFILSSHFSEIVMMDSSAEMVKVMEEKVAEEGLLHLKPALYNLEEEVYIGEKFDVIYNLLVMHHVQKIDEVLNQFSKMINIGGYLILTDLYSEDGSFHGDDFTGHNGFNPEVLAQKLKQSGFTEVSYSQCHSIVRENEQGIKQEFPLFMLIAKR